MIILDTSVVSALMMQAPDQSVLTWLDEQPSLSIWTTSITIYEIRLGIAVLPSGVRQRALASAFEEILEKDLENRILEFDAAAAIEAAVTSAERRRAGRSIDGHDTFIAGIALARRATIATRNVRHFAGLRISVVNPWTER